jgi:hypothetical protein
MSDITTAQAFYAGQDAGPLSPDVPNSGLSFAIAENLDDVLQAWRLLYQSYLRAGFIKPNPFGLHTVPHAIGPHTLVVIGHRHGEVASTISAISDSHLKLPLDSVYPDELDDMRDHGCHVVEIGLFGDDRKDVDRSFYALFELMRFATYYCVSIGATDVVCGIPPRRAKLYARAFAFEPIGPEKTYDSVEGHPVILLRSNIAAGRLNSRFHRAIDYFANHPVSLDLYERRFRFDPDLVANSILGEFLRSKCCGTHTGSPPSWDLQRRKAV